MLAKLDLQSQKQIEFIHSSSHKLKTPLFIMSGNLEILEKYGIDDREIFTESIQTLKNEVKDMNSLVEKLLFIARSNEIYIDKNEFEISDLILENIQILKRVYPNSIVNFEPIFIEVLNNSQLFELLFKNILENAIKYGNSKPVDVILNEDDSFIEIQVIDHGLGMTKSELNQIYDRFYRSDSSRNKKINGYGLGMSIVQRVSQLINAEIFIESEKDKGTKILIKLKK